MTTPGEPAPRRAQIWILTAVFFAPLLIAFFLYYGLDGWRPTGNTNHGELIDPARPLPQPELQSPAGDVVAADFMHGKWNLVYIGDGQCDTRCREALTLMRQTRLALGDDLTRVQRVFFVTENCCDRTYLDAEHGGLIAARLDDEAGSDLIEEFLTDDPVEQSGRIFIVDPLGNLMMSYAPGASPRGLLEDLKKLLTLSHIG